MKRVALDSRWIVPSKIVCVGRNYRAHIEEMGGDAAPSEPAIFIKPNSAIACGRDTVYIPDEYGLLHHEVELCFVVGGTCKDVDGDEAESFISGYGVGIDFTLRDLQSKAKSNGGPWALSKGFDGAAAFGSFVGICGISNTKALDIYLEINGERRQSGNTSQMIFSPADILVFVSRFMTLNEGDILMTGTPSGVGGVIHGDRIFASIEGLPALSVTVLRHG